MQLIYIYGSYLVLWLNDFKDRGILDTENEVREIFSMMTLLDAPGVLLGGVVMAFLADKVPTAKLVIPAVTLRACGFFAFQLVSDPRDKLAYLCNICVSFTSIFFIISLETLFMKRLPR